MMKYIIFGVFLVFASISAETEEKEKDVTNEYLTLCKHTNLVDEESRECHTVNIEDFINLIDIAEKQYAESSEVSNSVAVTEEPESSNKRAKRSIISEIGSDDAFDLLYNKYMSIREARERILKYKARRVFGLFWRGLQRVDRKFERVQDKLTRLADRLEPQKPTDYPPAPDAKIFPSGDNSEFNPESMNPEFDPNFENPEFNPQTGTPDLNPQAGTPDFNPQAGNPDFNSQAGTPDFNSQAGTPDFNPQDGNPKVSPQTGNLDFNSQQANKYYSTVYRSPPKYNTIYDHYRRPMYPGVARRKPDTGVRNPYSVNQVRPPYLGYHQVRRPSLTYNVPRPYYGYPYYDPRRPYQMYY